ncbi:hypothetical protein D3C79_646760 [compost metagenome]
MPGDAVWLLVSQWHCVCMWAQLTLLNFQGMHHLCVWGLNREHRHSRCQALCCILRGRARSHRDCAWPRVGAISVKAMAMAKDLEAGTVGVGAGLPANTGTAGARHCVAFFAGEPAPTGIVPGPGLVPFL